MHSPSKQHKLRWNEQNFSANEAASPAGAKDNMAKVS